MKRLAIVLSVVLIFINAFSLTAFADGIAASKNQNALYVSADKYVIMEAKSKSFLAGVGSNERFCASHFTKLMTLLIVCEKIDNNELSLDSRVTVGERANAQQGSQIWLDKGEEIKLSELVKAVTIGNANDACVCLSETVEPDEKEFLKLMNDKAKSLGMTDTIYMDCTGISKESITTAHDTALLCAEILKKDYLRKYFTTWRDFVRDGKAELVNQNTLVKSYNGITGLKACVSSDGSNMITASAERGEMSLICVASGCSSDDMRAVDARNMLDYGFSQFQVYTPKVDQALFEDIKITHGEDEKAGVSLSKPLRLVIKRGTASEMEVQTKREQYVSAPGKKGDTVGNITVKNGESTVFSADLVLEKDVKRLSVLGAFKKLLYSLMGK